MTNGKIPSAVIRRMARYLRVVLSMCPEENMITSSELGRRTGLPAERVRNDFHCFGQLGIQGRGYDRQQLIDGIRQAFGMSDEESIFLLGYDPLVLRMLLDDPCGQRHYKILTERDILRSSAV